MIAPRAGSGDVVDGLTPGLSAVQVMSEYVRAVRLLGHPAPEPTRLHTAYTAEDGMDLQALDTDARALSAAAAAAEETMLLQEQARRTLDGAWRGAGAQAAADQLRRNSEAAGAVADGLRAAARALDDLRNRLRQLVDAKVDGTLEVENRGMRTEWLAAARTVTTGAGDRSAASELVDLQVAPFVAQDIGIDWVSAMRSSEAAIRQAYRDAAAMAGGVPAVFEPPAAFVTPGAGPAAVEQVWSVPTGSVPATVPAAYSSAPAVPDPVAAPTVPVPASTPAAAAPVTPLGPPVAAPPEMPAPTPGGLGGMASPLGSGMSGLSGLGQSFADMLGGLLGAGGDGLGDTLGGADDLDLEPEVDDPTDAEPEDEEPGENPDEEPDSGDDPADDAETESEGTPEEPADTQPVEPLEAIEPVVPQPEPVPTPVPDPPVDPVAAAEPAPPETPCRIAADELPQAGP